MQDSPAFSSFRKLMDIWDETASKEKKSKEKKQSRVKSIIDGQNLIMFFKKGNGIFGAPEESRIVFARMKNPNDEEMPEDWANDANFNAYDLAQTLNGNSTENLFSMNDLPEIDVITRDEAENILMQCPCQTAQSATVKPASPIDKFGASAIQLKDRE